MIERAHYLSAIKRALSRAPIAMLLGPRQCGKTTLAREIVSEGSANYFDLEDPVSAARLEEPMTALANLRGLVVIDEAQRAPHVFPTLRVLADRTGADVKFLVLGSASPSLSRQASESLAGRVEIIDVRGFDLSEIEALDAERLWLRGGFPRSFLAASDVDSMSWRQNFARTYLERDLAALGFGMAPAAMRRFWQMISHYHGQTWNASEIAGSLGIAPNSAKNYLDALEQTFVVRRLLPWHVNLGKRLVKTPKVYFRDSGLFHYLQQIGTQDQLLTHPKLGASWEGFAMEEVLHALRPAEAFFYGVHSGAELDLFLPMPGRRLGIEFKRADAPKITRSMRIAIADLQLDELWIIYPGRHAYQLGEQIKVMPLSVAVQCADG